MMKTWPLKVFGINLLLFIAFFLVVNASQASSPDVWTRPSISFSDINESADYIQWEIKANENYTIEVNMVDEDGNKFGISFNTNDYYEEYDTSDNDDLRVVIGHDEDYADGTKKTYTSKFFSYLTSKHLDENNDITYNYTNEATVKTIYITGFDFSLYSLSLKNNDSIDESCWERDASDWDDLNDFKNDDGEISSIANPYIEFNNSNIHVTQKKEPNSSVYFPGYNYPGYGMYGYPYNGYPNYSPNYGGYPNYYPDRYAIPVSPQNPYGDYTLLPTGYNLYHGNPYNPNDPLYGTVAPPPISIPSGIINMMATSQYSPNDPDIAQIGYQLSLPYFQASVRSGWTPWRFPSGFQPYYGYGGYPWGY